MSFIVKCSGLAYIRIQTVRLPGLVPLLYAWICGEHH